MNETNSPLLTLEEAAEYLRISRTSLYRLIKSDNLKTLHLLERKQLVSRESLDAYITRCGN